MTEPVRRRDAEGAASPDQPAPMVGTRALWISLAVLAGALGLVAGIVIGRGSSPQPVVHRAAWGQSATQGAVDTSAGGGALETGASETGASAATEAAVAPTGAAATSAPDGDTASGASGDLVRSGVVRAGVPVARALAGLGVSTAEAQRIVNALDGIFDFRRARPGQRFSVTFSPSGSLQSFRYEASKEDIFEVRRQGDRLVGRRVPVQVDVRRRVFAGTITSSLFGTMQDLGAKPSLAAMVAEILSNQVDFVKEQRPGDTFRVLVEEVSLDGEFLRYGDVLALEYNGSKAGTRRLFRFQAGKQRPTYYDENLVSIPRSALSIPLYYSRLSSPFGWRIHPVLKRRKLHNGVDFSAPVGTPVWACADGTVVFAGRKGPNGNLVSIDHGNGLLSHYAHLQRFAPGIRKGVKVRRKQVIGYVGSTGRSTGPHLHWGLKRNGKFIDPLKYKVVPGKKVAPAYRPALRRLIAQLKAVLAATPIAPPKGEIEQVPEGDEPLGDY